MQAASDIFLGWCPAVGLDGRDRDFYVRQLWDWKRSAEVETMTPRGARGLRADLRLDPGARPRPLRRPGRRSAAYLGTGDAFDCAIAEFAESYADQSERDHAALVAAIDAGRVESQEL